MKRNLTDDGVRTRAWSELLRLYPGNKGETADALNLTRQGYYHFARGRHRQVPWFLCAQLAKLIRDKGTIDGSDPPTPEELVRSWKCRFGKLPIPSPSPLGDIP